MPRSKKPLSVSMKEGNGRRKGGVVVVDDVGEVSHGLVALVNTGGQDICGACGRVDSVDCALPASKKLVLISVD